MNIYIIFIIIIVYYILYIIDFILYIIYCLYKIYIYIYIIFLIYIYIYTHIYIYIYIHYIIYMYLLFKLIYICWGLHSLTSSATHQVSTLADRPASRPIGGLAPSGVVLESKLFNGWQRATAGRQRSRRLLAVEKILEWDRRM